MHLVTSTPAIPAPRPMPASPIKLERAGTRVLPSSPAQGGFWQLTLDGTVVGWATSYSAAQAKRQRLERARGTVNA